MTACRKHPLAPIERCCEECVDIMCSACGAGPDNSIERVTVDIDGLRDLIDLAQESKHFTKEFVIDLDVGVGS